MPRTASSTIRRRTRRSSTTSDLVARVIQLISTNEALRLENAELLARNEQLRAHLMEIGQALGRLAGPPRRGHGRRAEAPAMAEAKPRQQRQPITDPEQLERRRQALVRARAARAERLMARRAEQSHSIEG